ncbi:MULTISPECIES: ParB/RepB/Spo0J family partition protein [unclassified Mesorhizobium]|uniref:ParB/RepB/Spo0J family partition protein n=1 Tax=unclassified Mesorhizobium TaxID=325217 RepID=UPI001092520F|nr:MULTISPECIES: ParB/RepB/Spo0J family partition protein [unclassified Mesorhizobium]TGP85918.1 DNA-binding protein [Mesorhizobium sp. M8A.F.Ca.ET.218.01.1.1]TGT14828.1 DNA-binding protein [Mesorhizobium sp. M8A.F.Ca.ET.213.01.1.1]
MATNAKKITLSPSRDIPFNKLLLSQANVRRVKAGISIEELAEDIVRRGLLQGLSVRPVKDEAGVETGMFEIPAGGRRYRALELLVRQKRLAKTAPVPCVVREEGIAEEDSLAENVQRAPLHPLDQFRAFLALREKGQSEEEIAAAFFVSVSVVKQRLKLASVSPSLLETYAEDGLTLDQLMAFTVSGDHERQQQVFERMKASYDKQPYAIRRMLTEGAVRTSDKRVQFIGIEAYGDAGGIVMRDLFQGDDGGWLQDVLLVDRLVAEKLEREAEAVLVEGWKWIEVAPDFAYGHTFGLRQLRGEPMPLSAEEVTTREALQAEFDRLSEQYDSVEDLPDEIDQRLAELETGLESFEARPIAFDPADIARAGAFISIAPDGCLRVERGHVRPEDELPVDTQTAEGGNEHLTAGAIHDDDGVRMDSEPLAEPEDNEGLSPISDRLMTELTAHRTLGLRQALGERPDIAFLAALHALALKIFYQYGSESCLELDLKSISFGAQAQGLNDSICGQAIRVRHDDWAKALPKEAADLWDALRDWDRDRQTALFAHIVSLSVNAVHEAWNRRPRALAHADRLAQAVELDMAAAGWRPAVDNFLGRVTKARILQAVTEAKGQQAADRLMHLKKGDMASEAEMLIADAGWLPEPLRTPGHREAEVEETQASEPVVEPTAENDGETSMGEADRFAQNDEADKTLHTIAAE